MKCTKHPGKTKEGDPSHDPLHLQETFPCSLCVTSEAPGYKAGAG